MLYIAKVCPICEQGGIGFRRCSNGMTVVLMCDECESVWPSPGHVEKGNALFPSLQDFKVAEINCAIGGGKAGWATADEVFQAGWSSEVAGEWIPPYER